MTDKYALFKNAQFWTIIIALTVMVVQSFIPQFFLDKEIMTGMVTVFATYIVGVAIDPGGGIATLYKSRKFWVMLVGLVLTTLSGFGISLPVFINPEQLPDLLYLASILIGSVAVKDALVARK